MEKSLFIPLREEGLIKILPIIIIGLPIVALILIFGNKYLVDVCISVIAIMTLYEYFNSFKEEKENNALRWIGYLAALVIAFIHVIPQQYVLHTILGIIPVSILILFSQIILTDMKYNIKNIAITFFGICYIVLFMFFIPLIREMENGKILIWFLFIAAWGTYTFSYCIGRNFGKHKFSKISPNKSIEGCIAGTVGSVLIAIVYTTICNNVWNMNINYLLISIIAVVLSLVSQIGDFAASSIKRYTGIKDFSNLIPGHGGMLDRIDSVIFIAPFAYFLLTLI